ncbi:MAG: DUF5067 domain-containing protein [Clostridiales Family XIII bacterium]|jgi:hypothetical protein|nr:DUF5067 domain-containing protein [Clostridiales Family XIII bacterium]
MSEKNQEVQSAESTGVTAKKGISGLAITGLVIGILAIIGSWIPLLNFVSLWFAIIAIGFSIAGLLISIKGTKGGKGIAIAGLVLSIVTIVLFIVMYAGASALAGGDVAKDAAASNDVATSESNEKAAAAESEKAEPSDSGELGDYSFAIKDFQLVKDYEGKDAILIRFDFTNNSDEAKSFIWSADNKAFQDGIELETAIQSYDDGLSDDNASKDIQPGTTIEVYEVYLLSNTTSPVEVELTELISFSDDKLVKTFDIA